MTFNATNNLLARADTYGRRSIRLPKFDYPRSGAYFVTIGLQNRKCLFGEISDGKMHLNENGTWAAKCWLEIPIHFPHANLDEYVIMPNHIHGIIVLENIAVAANHYSPENMNQCLPVGANHYSPLHVRPKGTAKTIGSIIRGFKIGVTKALRKKFPDIQLWQRNYYEHVIRNEDDLNQTRQYIINNPLNWEKDENYLGG